MLWSWLKHAHEFGTKQDDVAATYNPRHASMSPTARQEARLEACTPGLLQGADAGGVVRSDFERPQREEEPEEPVECP